MRRVGPSGDKGLASVWLKKRSAESDTEHHRGVISVLLEPLPGYSDAEVVNRLRTIGAHRVEVLAPGFVSAAIERGRIEELEEIAEVGVKPQKRPLGAPH
jgi:hypothetical protein